MPKADSPEEVVEPLELQELQDGGQDLQDLQDFDSGICGWGPLRMGSHCFAVENHPVGRSFLRRARRSVEFRRVGFGFEWVCLAGFPARLQVPPRLPARHGDRGLMGNWFLAAGFSWFFARTVSIVMSAVPNWVGTPLQFVLGSYQLSVCGLKPADGLTGEDLAFRPLHRSFWSPSKGRHSLPLYPGLRRSS